MNLPPSPLEVLPRAPRAPGPRILLKREDLLPWGGGAKVRRFLAAFSEPSAGPQGARRRIAVLSDRGAHTFLALSRLHAADRLPASGLLFWERRGPRTAYADRIRAAYAGAPSVVVVRGSLPTLLARMLLARCFRRGTLRVLGIGGTLEGGTRGHREAFLECAAQLAAEGPPTGHVWHVVPASSGSIVDGFLAAIREGGNDRHRILAVLTGPWLARVRLRLRWLREPRVVLARPRPMHAPPTPCLASVPLDPRHGLGAAGVLSDPPVPFAPDDDVVFWVTAPR